MTSNSHGVYFGLKDGVYRTLDNGKQLKTGLNSAVRSFTVDAMTVFTQARGICTLLTITAIHGYYSNTRSPFAIHVNEKFIVFSNGGRIYKNLHDTVWTIVSKTTTILL